MKLHTVSAGVTRFCSISKNRCAVQRKGQLSIDGKLFFFSVLTPIVHVSILLAEVLFLYTDMILSVGSLSLLYYTYKFKSLNSNFPSNCLNKFE